MRSSNLQIPWFLWFQGAGELLKTPKYFGRAQVTSATCLRWMLIIGNGSLKLCVHTLFVPDPILIHSERPWICFRHFVLEMCPINPWRSPILEMLEKRPPILIAKLSLFDKKFQGHEFTINWNLGLKSVQERLTALLLNILNIQACSHELQKSSEKGHKMLCPPNISRHL